jgi:hypothetical protein
VKLTYSHRAGADISMRYNFDQNWLNVDLENNIGARV